MTKHRVTTAKAQALPETEDLERLNILTNGMADTLMYATQGYLNRAAAFNGEVIGFVGDRWRRDVDLGQSLARCGNWNEAIALQRNWAQHTVQDYLAEATKLIEIASKPDLSRRNPHPQPTTTAARGRKPTEVAPEAV